MSEDPQRSDEPPEAGVPGPSEGDKEQAEAGGAAQEVVESKHEEGPAATPGA
jgi:hypothetical protein